LNAAFFVWKDIICVQSITITTNTCVEFFSHHNRYTHIDLQNKSPKFTEPEGCPLKGKLLSTLLTRTYLWGLCLTKHNSS